MKKVVLILITLVLISGCTNNDISDKKTTECIAQKSIIYISAGCVACNKQKDLFGENFEYLNSIDCAQDPQKCRDVEIISVPTWIIEGKNYNGVKTIKELKELTGC